MYSIRAFKNTGFNVVNIPQSLSYLLNNFTYTSFDALDILQNEGLTGVSVRATWGEVKDIDYLVVYDNSGLNPACYQVGTPQMTSVDVAYLPLIYDAITSAGGPSSLTYLDGVTDRHTVGDDTMFKYTQSDEYMAPREALRLVSGGMLFNDTGIVATPVESTLDLVYLGKQFDTSGNFIGKGITFSDENGNQVTTPYTQSVTARTQYVIGDETSGPLSPNTRLYENDGSHEAVSNGLAVVRALSMEGSVISQVAYPAQFIETVIGTDGQYSTVRGKDQTKTTSLNFKYATPANNRVLYGDYNKYGLMTASGEKGEFLPEQIGDSSDVAPSVRSIADPRPDGKPYFRFEKYLGNQGDVQFYVCCVSGLEWANVPLTYTRPSGSYMSQINFSNGSRQAASSFANENINRGINYAQGLSNASVSLTGQTMDALNPVKTLMQGTSSAVGAMQTAMGITWDNMRFEQSKAYAQEQYELERNRELMNYGVSQSVVTPEVMFPFSANFIRDFIGNGVFVYRYRYSDSDVSRIDKLLTMYGYKDTVALTSDLFSKRQNFDYVRANGVSIGGTLPIWKKNLIAEQLSAGVRVWHTKPSPSYYTNNPIQ